MELNLLIYTLNEIKVIYISIIDLFSLIKNSQNCCRNVAVRGLKFTLSKTSEISRREFGL